MQHNNTNNKDRPSDPTLAEIASLERTIDNSLLLSSSSDPSSCYYFDQKHYHSFQGVSFLLPLRNCMGCGKRLSSMAASGFRNYNNPPKAVQCRACGGYAHRHCAVSKSVKWDEANFCTVNRPLSEENSRPNKEKEDEEGTKVKSILEKKGVISSKIQTIKSSLWSSFGRKSVENGQGEVIENDNAAVTKTSLIINQSKDESYDKDSTNAAATTNAAAATTTSQDIFRSPHESQNNNQDYKQTTIEEALEKLDREEEEEEEEKPVTSRTNNNNISLEWTDQGPPEHWATKESLGSLVTGQTKGCSTISSPTAAAAAASEENDSVKKESGVHFVSHKFSVVSRTLHQNVMAHFQPVVDKYLSKDTEEPQTTASATELEPNQEVEAKEEEEDDTNEDDDTFHRQLSKAASVDTAESASEAQLEGFLQEEDPESKNKKRLGIVTVVGGIAGGWAGLMLAGPVGGVIGGKMGQAIGISSIVLEGSVGIGVLASGIAAGRHAGEKLQDKLEENRVLALGDGTKQRILLVRPSVIVDAEWNDIYVRTRKSHVSFGGGIFPLEKKTAKKERYEREMDIVKTDEEELATADKVLLLVSRILNNRESLPGFVYQKLIQTLRQRSTSRGPLYKLFEKSSSSSSKDNEAGDQQHEGEPTTVDDDDDESSSKKLHLRRARRQDAHAVIKYVTATLLEVRPGFSASPVITELTATAVECLVFGEVYDLVIEEIEADYASQDDALLERIAEFERHQLSSEAERNDYKASGVSETALEALFNLPEAHSTVDKLRYCVFFLERISEYFSEESRKKKKSNTNSSMGADSLLKLVCQHILVAKVFGINAQIAFLEEFARDEQLLRGREGYALVTLQASLHFLNQSEDFVTDIFEQEDD